MTFTEFFTVHAIPPFDFDLSAKIFQSGDPQIRSYVNVVFYQVLKINGKLVLCKFSSKGTVQQPQIEVELKSIISLTSQDKEAAKEITCFIFNLCFDLFAFYKVVEKDAVMNQITHS